MISSRVPAERGPRVRYAAQVSGDEEQHQLETNDAPAEGEGLPASQHPSERPVTPRADRYALMAQVRVRRSSIDYVLDVIDISLSGALIDLGELPRPKWLKVRQEVLLTLLLDDTQQELKGEVVRIVEDLEGSRFAVRYAPSVALDPLRAALLKHGRVLPPPLPSSRARHGG